MRRRRKKKSLISPGHPADSNSQMIDVLRNRTECLGAGRGGFSPPSGGFLTRLCGFGVEARGFSARFGGFRARASGFRPSFRGLSAHRGGFVARVCGVGVSRCGFAAQERSFIFLNGTNCSTPVTYG